MTCSAPQVFKSNLIFQTESSCLHRLHLAQNVGIDGDIIALGSFPRLLYLNLSSTSVSGSLDVLRHASALKTLQFSFCTGLSGSLASLESLTSLEVLACHQEPGSESNIFGELRSLASLSCLDFLHIQSSTLTGSLEDLSSLTKLTYLCLRDNHGMVTGDLASLGQMALLKHLDLSEQIVLDLLHRNRIHGDIGVFSDHTEFNHINLEGLNVTGQPIALTGSPKLRYVNLVGTAVDGTSLEGEDAFRDALINRHGSYRGNFLFASTDIPPTDVPSTESDY